MKEEQKQKGLKAARYFGQEAEANREPLESYKEDIAIYFGFKQWGEIPSDITALVLKEFRKGREEERACHER